MLSEALLELCDDVTPFKNKVYQEEWITGPIPYHLFFKSVKYFSHLPESEDKTKLSRLLSKCVILPYGYTFL